MSDEKKIHTGYQALLFLALVPVTVLLNGWVASKLWLWFVVEPFDAPIIGPVRMIGIATLIKLFNQKYSKSDPDINYFALIGFSLLAPFISLGFGWLVRLFL